MAITVLVSSYAGVHFGASAAVTRDVGTGSNRYAAVLAGYTAGGTAPTGVTVGSDTLTLRGSVVTTSPTGLQWGLYTGDLTVTGSQAITGNFSGTEISGFATIVPLVIQGGGALTVGNFVTIDEFDIGSTGSETVTVTTTSGDTAFSIRYDNNFTGTPTVTTGTLVTNDGGPPGPTTAKLVASGSSTGIAYSWTGGATVIRTGFSVTEAGGGATDTLMGQACL